MDETISTLLLAGWDWLDSDFDALSLSSSPYWLLWGCIDTGKLSLTRQSEIQLRCTKGETERFPCTAAGWAACLERAKKRTMESSDG